MGFFDARSVKSQAIRDYAFPQTRLWKSGPLRGRARCVKPAPLDKLTAVVGMFVTDRRWRSGRNP
jgi:hypothetical protein